MGCRCGYSICSVCGNEAHTEDEFCDHILMYKGSTYNGLPVFEDNREVEFFEDSFVTEGADAEAKILEKVASRGGTKINKYNKSTSNPMYSLIKEEINQRNQDNRITTFADKLKNIQWN